MGASPSGIVTDRLLIGPWHELARVHGVDLVGAVRSVLRVETTAALPPEWYGDYDAARAAAFIEARDAESPTLLVLDRSGGEVVGFVIVFESPVGRRVDLRIGYVIAQSAAGNGYATEVVGALVAWAASNPQVAMVSGGVDATNAASIRVLERNGFAQVGAEGDELLYRLVC